jgi:hypothetical protein
MERLFPTATPTHSYGCAPSVNRTLCVLIAGVALAFAGCTLRGKPKVANIPPPVTKPGASATPAPPPAPPPPLSTPQTTVQLPPPQPLNPEALVVAPAPAEPAPQRTQRRSAPAPAPPKPEPAQQQPAQPPAPAAEPERPPVQIIVPADEQKRLQETAQAAKKEALQVLNQMGRRLNSHDQATKNYILSFVKQSDEAEQRGDMLQAAALAQRAQALARGWQSGR